MSKLVAQFDPSAGSGTFQAGAVNRCSTLWVMNESPNFVQLDFAAADTPKIVQPWYNKKLMLPNPVQTVNWSVIATLQSNSPPVSLVFAELYDPSEDTSALLSGPLQRQTNVGNSVSGTASSVVNDGSPIGTNVLEATPIGSVDSYALIRNDGTFDLKAISNNVETDILHLTPGDATHAAKLVARLLSAIGATQFDSGTIATDGNGNLTAKSFIAQSAIDPILTISPTLIAVQTTPGPGSYQGLAFYVWENGAALPILTLGTQENQSLGSVVGITGAGVIYATAPVQLISGHQETGYAGFAGIATAASQAWATVVNFKTVMSNVPSNVTLSAIHGSANCSATAVAIDKYGFSLVLTSVAAGAFNWAGNYTTVGN